MTAETVALVLIIFGVTAGILFLFSRTGKRVFRAERRLDEIESQRADVERQIRDHQHQISGRIAEHSQQIGQLTGQLTQESDRVRALSAQVVEMSGKLTIALNLIDIVRRIPVRSAPIDPEVLQEMAGSEMVVLAESISTLRPLVPYPNWHFDVDWSNADLAFQTRQQVWQCFHDRNLEAPVRIGWHLGTRLQLHLDNDLSRQIYVGGCIDPNEFAFLDRYLQPGMTFFDAGANEGIYTVFAAKRVGMNGTVWAFEPSQRELGRLRSNMDLNGLNGPNVRVFPYALADAAGRAELMIAGREHAGQNTLGAFAHRGVVGAGNQTVELRRLDDLVAETPQGAIDVIKLDVEGAELRVLKGAAWTLQRYRPVLLLEVSDASLRQQGDSRDALVAYLTANNYSLYYFDHSGVPSIAPEGTYSDNMLAVPKDMALPQIVFQAWPCGGFVSSGSGGRD